jgi:hypothetical protein
MARWRPRRLLCGVYTRGGVALHAGELLVRAHDLADLHHHERLRLVVKHVHPVRGAGPRSRRR